MQLTLCSLLMTLLASGLNCYILKAQNMHMENNSHKEWWLGKVSLGLYTIKQVIS